MERYDHAGGRQVHPPLLPLTPDGGRERPPSEPRTQTGHPWGAQAGRPSRTDLSAEGSGLSRDRTTRGQKETENAARGNVFEDERFPRKVTHRDHLCSRLEGSVFRCRGIRPLPRADPSRGGPLTARRRPGDRAAARCCPLVPGFAGRQEALPHGAALGAGATPARLPGRRGRGSGRVGEGRQRLGARRPG